MKRIAIEDGTWVKFLNGDRIMRGRIEKKYQNKPLTKDNYWVNTKDGYYQPDLEEIIYVYPKVFLKVALPKINPSLRMKGGES